MSISRGAVAEEFAQLAIELHNLTTAETVEKVLDFALNAVGCDHAVVTLGHPDRHAEIAAATSELVAALETVQKDVGERPEATVLGDPLGIVVRDTLTETRWPSWAARVAATGIRSLMSIPMHSGDNTIGTLNLYSMKPDAFDTDDRDVAHLLAIHASNALATAREIENLWHAVDARKQIGQAQGILMERLDLTADRAFAVLLRYSQDHNLKLRAVADRLVQTRELPRPWGDE